MHVIAGKAIAFQAALGAEFKTYQQHVVKNADGTVAKNADGTPKTITSSFPLFASYTDKDGKTILGGFTIGQNGLGSIYGVATIGDKDKFVQSNEAGGPGGKGGTTTVTNVKVVGMSEGERFHER